jgi:hypothetical protein
MAPAGFEPIILAVERSQTYALDGAASGIGYGTLQLHEYRQNDSRVPSSTVHTGSHLQC